MADDTLLAPPGKAPADAPALASGRTASPALARPGLGELFRASLLLGLVGFGGGVSVLATIETLAVRRRRWLTEQEFTNAATVAQMLPGGAASNALAFLGLKFHGFRGAATAYGAFVLPGTILITVLAWVYTRFGSVPHADALLSGLNAAVVGIIIAIALRMLRTSIGRPWQMAVATVALLLSLVGGAGSLEVAFLGISAGLAWDFGMGKARAFRYRLRRGRPSPPVALPEEGKLLPHTPRGPAKDVEPPIAPPTDAARAADAAPSDAPRESTRGTAPAPTSGAPRDSTSEPSKAPPGAPRDTSSPGSDPTRLSLGLLALAMPAFWPAIAALATLAVVLFRTGLGAYGGGFAIIPSLHADMIAHGWLTERQFADAVAVGKLTPGPVLLMATFIGYLRAGLPGALVATLAILAAPFLLVVFLSLWLERVRSQRWVRAALRGLTPAVVGMMVAAALTLGNNIQTGAGLAIAAGVALTLIRFDTVNPVAMLAIGGLTRMALHAFWGL